MEDDEDTAEVPDQHVFHLADQFLATAELLAQNMPGVVAPSSLRVNAAFAIELYMKSLNSHWKIDRETCLVSTHSNARGHKLDDLFGKLPDKFKQELAAKRPDFSQLLKLYSATFEIERYGFEETPRPYEGRPTAEIVLLARVFRDYVHSLPVLRY